MKYLLACFVVLAGLAGCIEDPRTTDGPDGPIVSATDGITLTLKAPEMQTATRAFTEDQIATVTVLVFDSSDNFLEVIDAQFVDPDEASFGAAQVWFPLSRTLTDFKLVVVANAPERFLAHPNTGDPMIPAVGTPKSEIIGDYVFYSNNLQKLYWRMDGYSGIPMYGESLPIASFPEASSAIEVELVRSLAGVKFVMNDPDSEMQWVRFNRYTARAVLAGRENSNNTDWRVAIDATQNPAYSITTEAEKRELTLYVPEQSAMPENPSLIEYRDGPCVIVQAKYGSSFYYYRINITSDGSVPGYDKGDYIPVTRNHKYVININKVDGPGYTTLADAQYYLDELNNIDYTVNVIDDGSSKSIVYDGRNYLAVSTNEVVFEYGNSPNVPAQTVTVETNFDHSAQTGLFGWTASSDHPEWILLNGGTAVNGPVGKSTLTISPSKTVDDVTKFPRTTTITITNKSGNTSAIYLTQTIRVTQKSHTSGISVTTSQDDRRGGFDETTGRTVAFYTWEGERFIGDQDAQIYAEWDTPMGTGVTTGKTIVGGIGLATQQFLFSGENGYVDLDAPMTWSEYTKPTSTPNPYLFEVSPDLVGGAPSLDKPVKAYVTFRPATAPGAAAVDPGRINFVRKDYTAGPMAENSVMILDGTYTYLTLAANVGSFTLELVNCPSWFSGGNAAYNRTFTAPNSGGTYYGNPLNTSGFWYVSIGSYLPRITREEWEDKGESGPFELRFKITSAPCVEFPEVVIEDYFTVQLVPVAESANSYIAKPGEVFAIPVARAATALGNPDLFKELDNTNTNLEDAGIVGSVLWSDKLDLMTAKGSGKGSSGHVIVQAGTQEGNGTVSVTTQGGDGSIRWSWLVWITAEKDDIEAGYGTNGMWMDRNLGAFWGDTDPRILSTFTTAADFKRNTYGLLYQWGRKDAFPLYASGASNNFYISGTDTKWSVGVRLDSGVTNLLQSVNKPLSVADAPAWGGSDRYGSWYDATGGGKTLFDPCPYGWRVPLMVDYPATGNYALQVVNSEGRLIDFGSSSSLPTATASQTVLVQNPIGASIFGRAMFMYGNPAGGTITTTTISTYSANISAAGGNAQLSSKTENKNLIGAMRCIRYDQEQ